MALMDADIKKQLDRIERLLARLVQPVEVEETRQLIAAPREQRKQHNAALRARKNEELKGARS